MAFLYSDPLMMLNDKREPQAFCDPLDTEKEFHRLKNFLCRSTSEKRFFVKREAATQQSLSQILQMKPTILHISCHGLEKDKKRANFCLAFESNENKTYLELFSENKLRKLLNLEDQ
jgi:CHAT domain